MNRITLLVILVILFSGVLFADETQPAASQSFPAEIIEVYSENCPVMGGKINKAVNTVIDGKIYYFCCPGCIGMFSADPAKYAEKLANAVLTTLKVTNVDGKCPATGLAADLKFFKIDEVAKTITFYHNEESKDKN